jgi:hypothetical protein
MIYDPEVVLNAASTDQRQVISSPIFLFFPPMLCLEHTHRLPFLAFQFSFFGIRTVPVGHPGHNHLL